MFEIKHYKSLDLIGLDEISFFYFEELWMILTKLI